jgi:alpha-tubulin suppressor-like RCC1 family protein
MRHQLTASLLLAAVGLIAACGDEPVSPATTGSIALEFVIPSDSVPDPAPEGAAPASQPELRSAAFDAARATAIGPQTKEVQLSLSGSNWVGSIDDLTPGTYRVVVEGFVAGEVDWYGEASSVVVQAGRTATASVSFDTFVPVLDAVPSPTTSTIVTVTFPSVSYATSYNVQWGTDPSFGSYNTISNVTGTSVDIDVGSPGLYYVRIQAANTQVPGGIWSDSQSFRVVSTTFSGNLSVTSGGFADALTITRDPSIPWDGDEWVLIGGIEPWVVSQNLNSMAVLVPDVALGSQTMEIGGQGPGDVYQTTSFNITSEFTPNSDYTTAPDISGGPFPMDFYISLSDLETVHFLTVAPPSDLGLRVRIEWQTGADIDIYWTDAGVTQDVGNYDGATLSQPEVSTTTVPGGITWRLALFKFDWNDPISTPTSMARVRIETVSMGLITAGQNHSCGITGSGAAWCWGANFLGQLGEGGAVTFSDEPVAVAGGHSFASLDAGAYFTCGVTTSSAAYCWGQNSDGRLGDGTFTTSNAPVPVAGPLFSSVTAGGAHACAVEPGGAGHCWGSNGNGQLGDGTTTASNTPVGIGGYLWLEIEAGGSHTCGITTDGDALCWGYNFYGQLGDGTFADKSLPALVQGGHKWKDLAAGWFTSCGVTADVATGGEVYCWGAGSYLGDSHGSDSPTPVLAVSGIDSFVSVSMHGGSICAITSYGEVYCWADSYYGQAGDWGEGFNLNPVSPASTEFFRSVSAGAYHTCAGTDAGTPFCWGRNLHGQVGHDYMPFLIPMNTGYSAVAIDAGRRHACLLDGSSDAYCWGTGGSGQLGDGLSTNSADPVLVSAPAPWQQIATGEDHTCGLTTGGSAYCWGFNGFGQVGDNTFNFPSTPSAVWGGGQYDFIDAGLYHTCAVVTTTGAVHCWGRNDYGQLGDNSTTDANTPQTVLGLTAAKVYGGGFHSCALDAGGNAFCWGRNNYGQLGNTSFVDQWTPVPVSLGLTFQSLQLGQYHTCGVSGPNVYCWGAGWDGQVGDGTFSNRNVPTPVGAYAAVGVGYRHSCAISGGSVSCWGDNRFGQVGNGTKTDSETSPVAGGVGYAFQQIAGGRGFTCGIITGGIVYCWGENSDGQCGVGYRGIEVTPVQVAGGLVLQAPRATAAPTRRDGKAPHRLPGR